MRYVTILLLLLGIAAGCKSTEKLKGSGPTASQTLSQAPKGAKAEDQQVLPDIAGTWMWVKTQCCGRNQKTTTDSINTPTFLEFKADNTFAKTRKNETLQTGDYRLEFDFNLNMPVLQTSTRPQAAIIHFNADTLLIDYGYMDLQTEYYVRPKR